MSDRRIVLDLETQRTFDDVGGRNNLDKLGITVVGIYRYETDEYSIYREKDLGQLQNLLIDASLIIGFNHVWFDMPVMQPYFSVDVKKLPCFDIMLDLQKHLGHRVGLDSVAQATLGTGKSANGLDAIRFYKEGRWAELEKYCLDDVKVTKAVFDHGLKNKSVSVTPKFGTTKKEVKVDWSEFGPKKAAQAFATSAEPAQYKLF